MALRFTLPMRASVASWVLIVRRISSSEGMGCGTSTAIAATSALHCSTDSASCMAAALRDSSTPSAFSISLIFSRMSESSLYLCSLRASFWLRRSAIPLSMSASILLRASRSSWARDIASVPESMVLRSSSMERTTESSCICRDSFCFPSPTISVPAPEISIPRSAIPLLSLYILSRTAWILACSSAGAISAMRALTFARSSVSADILDDASENALRAPSSPESASAILARAAFICSDIVLLDFSSSSMRPLVWAMRSLCSMPEEDTLRISSSMARISSRT